MSWKKLYENGWQLAHMERNGTGKDLLNMLVQDWKVSSLVGNINSTLMSLNISLSVSLYVLTSICFDKCHPITNNSNIWPKKIIIYNNIQYNLHASQSLSIYSTILPCSPWLDARLSQVGIHATVLDHCPGLAVDLAAQLNNFVLGVCVSQELSAANN